MSRSCGQPGLRCLRGAGRGVLLLYTPHQGFTGQDRLTYTLGVPSGQRRAAAVELTVTKDATQ